MFLFSNTNIIIKVLQVARGRRKTSPPKKCLENLVWKNLVYIITFLFRFFVLADIWNINAHIDLHSLRKKCINTELFLVRIFLYSDLIRRDTPYLSVFSPNTGKYGPKIIPFLETFHAVIGLVEAAL